MQTSMYAVNGRVTLAGAEARSNRRRRAFGGGGRGRAFVSLSPFNCISYKKCYMSNNRRSCFGLRVDSVPMATELSRMNFFRSRPVKALASDGDIEDVSPLKPQDVSPVKPQGKSSGTVLPFVGVACLGAILFGYHLGVVNGALEYLAKDLGIAENAVLQGKKC